MNDRRSPEAVLRRELLELLRGRGARMPFADAVAAFPMDAINRRAPNVGYTPWHLLEHLRITQRDILDYIRNDDYHELSWPDDYWPDPDAQATADDWNRTVDAFATDLEALQAIVGDDSVDLTAPLPHAPQHTTLREIRTVGDHNAYHVGEFAILRQVMGTWPADHER